MSDYCGKSIEYLLAGSGIYIYLFLEQSNVFICTDEIHLYCLHLVYLPLINQTLTEFAQQWNDHPVSMERNYTPRKMWVQGMLQLRHSNLTAVQSVIGDADHMNPEEYGVDEEGPVPVLERTIAVLIRAGQRGEGGGGQRGQFAPSFGGTPNHF